MDKIREIEFPNLILDKQDRSKEYGYHWVETNGSFKRHAQVCVLLREEGGYGYYLPLKPPYEICREDNFPRPHSGHYVIQSSEPEYKALRHLVPSGVFMPVLEYCNNITPAEWFDAYIAIVTTFPDMIRNVADFSFMVGSCDELYAGYYLICHPFVNMIKGDDGVLRYTDERTWAVKETSSIKIDGEYRDHCGNVYFFKKEYMEEWFGGSLLPVICVKE